MVSLVTIESYSTKFGLVQTNDTTNWIGYGSFSSQTPNISFDLNSGETYEIIIYCVIATNGSNNKVKGSWIQPSNEDLTTILQLELTKQISLDSQLILGDAIRKTLKINRDIYTDDGIMVPSFTNLRLLQTSSSNTSNSSVNSHLLNKTYIHFLYSPKLYLDF